MSEEKKESGNNEIEENIVNAGIAGAQTETVQRYGAAIKEHVVAYSGVDRETGQHFSKGLKGVSKSKINPEYKDTNIKQQAGFSAEIKTQARERAEDIIKGNHSSKSIRTDDMIKQSDGKGGIIGGTNDQYYDIGKISQNGSFIQGTGRQLKYYGKNADDCYKKLLDKKIDKYRDADIPLEIPSDFYDDVRKRMEDEVNRTKEQLQHAKNKGNTQLAKKCEEKLERINKTENCLRKGKVTSNEAIEARLHPGISTVKDTVRLSHQAGIEAATYGAAIGGTYSIVQNLVAVAQGKKEMEDAVFDVAKDTTSSIAIGYGTGFIGSSVKGVMQNSGLKTVQALSKTNLPGILVDVSLKTTTILKKYYDGEINGVECFEELGEQGTGMISSAMFATIGQMAIPIPVVGGLIGGMLGYAVASSSYGILLGALKEAKLAEQERERIEKECERQIELIKEYRKDMEAIIEEYLVSHIETFHNAFSGIKTALEIGDVDNFIASSNQITKKLGKKVLFENMDELEMLMNSNIPIKL